MRLSGTREYQLLKQLAYTRLAGTPEEEKAANLLAETIREIGLTPEVDIFDIEDAKQPTATLTVTEPYCKTYEVTGYKCCKSTPEGGMDAPLIYAESMLDANLVNAKDAIVLVQMPLTVEKYRRLLKAGVAGFITMGGDYYDNPKDTGIVTRKLRKTMTVHGLTSGAHIRVKDAMEMVEKHASKIHLDVQNENEIRQSRNVYVELQGTEIPDEIVSFGAHYDSVEFSKGVYDNGSGAVILMELLRYFKENPPKRTLRFHWYGSEEIGLEGSKHFVKTHEAELEKHVLMINVDMAGPVLGRDVAIVTADDSLRVFTDYFMKTRGYAVDVAQRTYSSDNMPFADKKVPAISFARLAAPGAGYYHSKNDHMTFMSAETLLKTTLHVLDFAKEMVNAAVFPVPKTMPEDMVKKIDEYFYKKEFKEAEEKAQKSQ
ncbi:Peptidase family M28 [Lachnospiraceae bacterium XBB1006]|nr:Peptidase family M28 [Lachnospiraceae bacterium XBB1006]